MSGVTDVGVRAMLANQSALQTIGHNIANVNTEGYSRQTAVMGEVAGQFSGSGYFGKGVEITTVKSNYSEFLTRQSAIAKAVAASDTARYDNLRQLENIFLGGPDGLGAAISNMLNAVSDVVNSPTDLTSRSVVLNRADEMAARVRSVATQLNDLRTGAANQLRTDVKAVNTLAQQIAQANDEIARSTNSGHAPNDLIDQRNHMISELSRYVRTTVIPADDGSLGVFLANGLPLVLGTTVGPVKLVPDKFGDPDKLKLAMDSPSGPMSMEEAELGGGEIAGLLRFQNQDLVDASNLLGRLALAVGTLMNDQQKLGLTLKGQPGQPLFNFRSIPDGYASTTNSKPGATISMAISPPPADGPPDFAASDYEMVFDTATTGYVTRLSDGEKVSFDFGVSSVLQFDGLDIQMSAGTAAASDRFILKPFSTVANAFSTAFSSPRELAMASAAAATAAPTNQGTLTLDRLRIRTVPVPDPVTITFTGATTYTRSDTGATEYTFASLSPIEYDLNNPPVAGWSLVLKGVPQAGDSYTVGTNPYPNMTADNALAMLDLRDAPMFDGAVLTDGYAAAIAQIGVKIQGAQASADISTNIATNVEKDRAGVSSVNLDEEAARLLQYQQAYQAAGKMLQIAQSMFDTLLQNLTR